MTFTRKLAGFALAAAMILPGCSDSENLRDDVLAAVKKQANMTAYHFDTQLQFHTDSPWFTASDNQPITQSLLTLLKQSSVHLEGIADNKQARMEGKLTLSALDESSSYTVPILIKDQQLLFSIPNVNNEGSYFSLNLKQDNKQADLTQSSVYMSRLLQQVVESVDDSYFETVKSKDGQTKISAEITPSRFKPFLLDLRTQLPDMITELEKMGAISKATSEEWISLVKKPINLFSKDKYELTDKKPGKFTFAINKEGFLTSISIFMDVTYTSADGNSSPYMIDLTLNYNDINKNPAFKQEIPKDVLPLEEVWSRATP